MVKAIKAIACRHVNKAGLPVCVVPKLSDAQLPCNNNNPYHTAIANLAIGPAPQINFRTQFWKDKAVQTTNLVLLEGETTQSHPPYVAKCTGYPELRSVIR